jgi:hypothetical protein
MPAVVGGVSGRAYPGRGGAAIHMELRPPMSFILAQTGAFKRALKDGLPLLWEAFKGPMESFMNEQWATKGRGQWPPLAQATLDRKAGRYSPWPLIRTEELFNSISDPGQAMRIMGDSAEWATDVDYAGYHQDGTSHMPARQIIPDPFPVEWRQELERESVRWVDAIAAATMGRI